MKINRLLEITITLLNRKAVTAKELADRFGVSSRTIYRDIEVLSSAGVPVYTNKGNGGGISLLEDYTLNKTMLSKRESESLLLALKTIGATRYPEVDAVLDKIGGLFKTNQVTDWIDIDFAGWTSHPNEKNKFSHIRNAIINEYVIRFDYINADGEKSNRFAEPQKLIFNTSAWYLVAFCLKRNAQRMFRISRIKNVQVTDKHFTKREMPCKENAKMPNSFVPFINLKLRFSEKALYRLYDDFDEYYITKNPDGSFDVSVSLPENEWIYGYIMSFGNYVEVLEPEHIRKSIIERMQDALKKYN